MSSSESNMSAFVHFWDMARRGLVVSSSNDGCCEYPGVLPTDMVLYGRCVNGTCRKLQGEVGWPLRIIESYRARGGAVVASLGGGSVRSDHPYVQGIMHVRHADIFVQRVNLMTDKIAVVPKPTTEYVVVHVSDPRKDRRALEPEGGLYGDIARVLRDIAGR